jgi:hypothetical protein
MYRTKSKPSKIFLIVIFVVLITFITLYRHRF